MWEPTPVIQDSMKASLLPATACCFPPPVARLTHGADVHTRHAYVHTALTLGPCPFSSSLRAHPRHSSRRHAFPFYRTALPHQSPRTARTGFWLVSVQPRPNSATVAPPSLEGLRCRSIVGPLASGAAMCHPCPHSRRIPSVNGEHASHMQCLALHTG